MPILHRFRDTNIYLPKIETSYTSRDLNHATWGQFVIITRLVLLASTGAQNLTILSSAILREIEGVQNFEMDHVTQAAPF